ncbi:MULTISPECIES: PepSY domain-containing protein [unclassified Brevibacterium]|uniref:PepSY domain-containing protein n=1 Tax=unclassified Brevibacterium TaxID=2614124 RepID=UPI001F0E8800|nr:PepSY domain-containing protein [Brevibacterium sp. S111]
MKTNRMAMSTVAGLAALTLGLAGCSGSDSGDGADEAQNSPAASESTSDSTTEDAEDQGEDTGDDTDSEQGSKQDSSGDGLSADADLSKDTPATSAEDAIKTAEKKVGDGIVHGIELDWDEKDQAWQYEVSILDGSTDHDVEIDADSGKIVKHEQDSTDDKEKAIDLNDPMTFDEALELAQKKASGKLVGWKLEYDDNMKEFQFDFDKGGEETEVTVDTETERVTVDD